MIKYIISDCDGTLLNQYKEVDSLLVKVIKELSKINIGFSLASGRNRDLMIDLVEECSVQLPFISDNGANIYIRDEARKLYSSSLGIHNTNQIIEFCQKNNVPFIAYGDEAIYEHLFSIHLQPYRKLLESKKIIQLAQQIEKNQFLDCYKITIDLHHFLNTRDIVEEINRIDSSVIANRSEGDLYTITEKRASKGNAVKRFAKLMSCDCSEIMVFGDNYNDFSMFETVEISVAMKNSNLEVKEKAAFVTKYSNNENGVSEFLIAYFKLNI